MRPSLGETECTCISDQLIADLRADAALRRIGHGFSLLRTCSQFLKVFDPSLKNAASFLQCVSQWVCMGYPDPGLGRLVACYDKHSRKRLPLVDYVDLRVAEGMVAMSEGKLDCAVAHFDFVTTVANEIYKPDLLAITNYWKARCLRAMGKSDEAWEHIMKARELALESGSIQMDAAFRVLASVILFEKGDRKSALRSLCEAAAVLIQTDDYCTLGNIEATYGRILEEEGQFGQAIAHFTRALEQFKRRASKRGYVARVLLDISYTRLLVARDLRRSIDADSEQRRKGGVQRQFVSEDATPSLREELWSLHDEIVRDLDRAAKIYSGRPSGRGLSRVHLYRGYLYLNIGDLDIAGEHAAKCYALSETNQELVLMASARNLQCLVENSRVEEQVEERIDRALAAYDFLREAQELAKQAKDRKLLAHVYVCSGLTLSNNYFNAPEGAREAMQLAAKYMEPGDHDVVRQDFDALQKRLQGNDGMDTRLLSWARGQIGCKTFRELKEEFADVVIAKTWSMEGQKVSRVASRLAISPKKVRRVLARLGLHEARELTSDGTDRILNHS